MFQLSPEGRKNVECINRTLDFPCDVFFFSRDLGEGALRAWVFCFVLFFVSCCFKVYSLCFSLVFYLQTAGYLEAKGKLHFEYGPFWICLLADKS